MVSVSPPSRSECKRALAFRCHLRRFEVVVSGGATSLGMLKRGEAGVSGCCVLDVRLWGKESGLPRSYPVVCHLLDTSAVFQELWDVVVSNETRLAVAGALGLGLAEARSVVSFWAGLHDIGKISPLSKRRALCSTGRFVPIRRMSMRRAPRGERLSPRACLSLVSLQFVGRGWVSGR